MIIARYLHKCPKRSRAAVNSRGNSHTGLAHRAAQSPQSTVGKRFTYTRPPVSRWIGCEIASSGRWPGSEGGGGTPFKRALAYPTAFYWLGKMRSVFGPGALYGLAAIIARLADEEVEYLVWWSLVAEESVDGPAVICSPAGEYRDSLPFANQEPGVGQETVLRRICSSAPIDSIGHFRWTCLWARDFVGPLDCHIDIPDAGFDHRYVEVLLAVR